MKIKSSRYILILLLAITLCLSLVLFFFPSQEELTAEDIQRCLNSLGSENPDDPTLMRERAYKLATILFDDPAQCEEFADEVTEIYFNSEIIDFLLVYNTGGFGGGTMAEDPEWPSILDGIEAELEALGYTSMVIEHQRGEKGLAGFLSEVDDLIGNYPSKAPELAAKVAFLTKYNPDLKVITTGRCFGAIFSNEVMQLEAANPQLYSIQAGVPFWYTDPSGERTLVIENNGTISDTFSEGSSWTFLWAFFKSNLEQFPSTSPHEEGSIRLLNWYFKMPGHTYTWEYPEIRSCTQAFLEENFAND